MNTPTYVSKEFKTLQQQIDLLKSRKLIIRNEEAAKKQLLEKNYFNLINGFETLLLNQDDISNKNYKSIYFEDFIFLFDLDRFINSIIFQAVNNFESRLKSSMAYRFCEQNYNTINDVYCYLDTRNYTNPQSNHLSLPADIKYNLHTHKIFRRDRNTQENYAQIQKRYYKYLQTYQHPPFWAVIKTLEFGPTFKLLLAYEKTVFEKVINDMGMSYIDKQKFINSIRILIGLRNASAHFELINRYRTPQNLRIDAGLINTLNLQTKVNNQNISTYYELKLYDILLVLAQFEDLSDLTKILQNYYYKKCKCKRRKKLLKNLLERMGRGNLKAWENLSK